MIIYLAQQENSNKYKIGISKDPTKRLKSLQTANGENLILIHSFLTENSFRLESYLHRKYNNKKIHLEWFELSEEEVSNFLNECKLGEDNLNLIKNNNTWYQERNVKKRKWY